MHRSLILVELELEGKICSFASYIHSLLCQNKSDTGFSYKIDLFL